MDIDKANEDIDMLNEKASIINEEANSNDNKTSNAKTSDSKGNLVQTTKANDLENEF